VAALGHVAQLLDAAHGMGFGRSWIDSATHRSYVRKRHAGRPTGPAKEESEVAGSPSKRTGGARADARRPSAEDACLLVRRARLHLPARPGRGGSGGRGTDAGSRAHRRHLPRSRPDRRRGRACPRQARCSAPGARDATRHRRRRSLGDQFESGHNRAADGDPRAYIGRTEHAPKSQGGAPRFPTHTSPRPEPAQGCGQPGSQPGGRPSTPRGGRAVPGPPPNHPTSRRPERPRTLERPAPARSDRALPDRPRRGPAAQAHRPASAATVVPVLHRLRVRHPHPQLHALAHEPLSVSVRYATVQVWPARSSRSRSSVPTCLRASAHSSASASA
jgi:hypothetical protein